MAAKGRASLNASEEYSKKLGVLYTGYLDKKNPVTGAYKKRYVVLTLEAVHWFVREEGYDLFGAERGRISLGAILSVRVLDEDSTVFEIQSTDHAKRFFRCSSPTACEEWVSSIRSAIKGFSNPANSKAKLGRRSSFRGLAKEEEEETAETAKEVSILLVSLRSKGGEVVISRTPGWDRIINVQDVKLNDQLLISISNGGFVVLTAATLEKKAEEGVDFETAVQNVMLSSSIRITVQPVTSINGNRINGEISPSSPPTSNSPVGEGPAKDKRKAKTILMRILHISLSMTSIRENSIRLVLSLMVFVVGLGTFFYVSASTSLLCLLAISASSYEIYTMVEVALALKSSSNRGSNYTIVIHGHAYTSPDAPINAPEDEIPQRFIDGCEGDLKEARKRWDITRHWRETEGVNRILAEPQPHYFTLKAMYPHYHAGRGKSGHIVYYERPGEIEIEQIIARGISIPDMVRHWLFVTEYQWEVLCGGDQAAKGISVIDMEKISINSLTGDTMVFLKTTIGYANHHYPERSLVIFIVNAPWYFTMLWKIVKPMVHENTQRKVRILSKKETFSGLQEHIEISNIPEYYGGQLRFGPFPEGEKDNRDSCRFFSPEVLALTEFVKRLNNKEATVNPFDTQPASATSSVSAVPPGKPGEFAPALDTPLSRNNDATVGGSMEDDSDRDRASESIVNFRPFSPQPSGVAALGKSSRSPNLPPTSLIRGANGRPPIAPRNGPSTDGNDAWSISSTGGWETPETRNGQQN